MRISYDWREDFGSRTECRYLNEDVKEEVEKAPRMCFMQSLITADSAFCVVPLELGHKGKKAQSGNKNLRGGKRKKNIAFRFLFGGPNVPPASGSAK